MAEPSRTRGASLCWECRSMPEAFRMWLDSFWPLSGSCRVNSDSPMGIPTRAMSIPHRQLCPTVTTSPKIRMPTV